MRARDRSVPGELADLLPVALRALCEPVVLERGAVLFQAGTRPSYMHHVEKGEVVLQRTNVDGGLVVLQRVREGWVAEASLEATSYHCDGVAIAATRLTRLPRAALRQALRSDAGFAARWLSMLNAEVRRLRQRCERLTLNTVRARLLHLMETEAGPQGLPIGGGLKALSVELGVSHEALYRCVADLERVGALRRLPGPPRMIQLVGAAAGAGNAAGR